jgi:hypothetical protein
MDKKQIFLVSLLALFTLALSAGAFYQYDRHQVKVDVAVQKANRQRDSAIEEARGLKAAQDFNLQSAQAEIRDYGIAQARLCATITKAKLTDPACH